MQAAAQDGYVRGVQEGIQACRNAAVQTIDRAPLPFPIHDATGANDLRNFLKNAIIEQISSIARQTPHVNQNNDASNKRTNDGQNTANVDTVRDPPASAIVGVTSPSPSLPSSAFTCVQQKQPRQRKRRTTESPPVFPTPLAKRSSETSSQSNLRSGLPPDTMSQLITGSNFVTASLPFAPLIAGLTPSPLNDAAAQAQQLAQSEGQQANVQNAQNLALQQYFAAFFAVQNNNINSLAPTSQPMPPNLSMPLGNLPSASNEPLQLANVACSNDESAKELIGNYQQNTSNSDYDDEKENEALIVDVVESQESINDSRQHTASSNNDDSGISSPPSQSEVRSSKSLWRPY